MGKKPRSQRRKRGSNLDDGDDGDNTGDTGLDVDVLSEDHTVADTLATFDEFDNADGDDISVEDLISTGSVGTSAPQVTSSRHAKLVECLSLASDIVGEKRSAKRESGLRRIFRGLTQYATYHTSFGTIQNYQTEIVQASVHGLRVGNPAEQYAACRVLEALAVILGGNQDDYVEDILSPLQRVLAVSSRAVMVRGAALRALSMAHFICASSDDVTTEQLLDLCEAVAAPEYRNHAVPATLRATALDCWALLSTTIHDLYISGNDGAHIGRGLVMLPLLKEALEDPSLELRAAAGECMTIIHESRLNLGDSDGENITERKFSQGSWEDSEYEDIVSEIQQRISELSNQSGHYLSKKAKKEQRAAFREFQATVVDDEEPEETIAFRGGSLTLTSWKEIVQLNFVRHCLQGGFQIQLLTNPTLQAIFGADGQVLGSHGTMSQLEKRLILSKTSEASKAAYQDMTKKRRVRNNVKNHFLTADGEEI